MAVHLIVASDKALLLQPSTLPPFTADAAAWLTRETSIPTTLVQDDILFGAAIVSLGSLGLVHAVLLEATPLYRLWRRQVSRSWADAQVWSLLRTLDTTPFHADVPQEPYHVDLVLHPYPPVSRPGAFVTLAWDVDAGTEPPTHPLPVPPDAPSDVMGLIGDIGGALPWPIATPLLRHILSGQLEKRYPPGDFSPLFPGQFFGPTSLPPGRGASTEIVVDYRDSATTLELVFEVLAGQASHGRHLAGAVAVRFVPKTRSLLGANIHAMNTYIELPSIRNSDAAHVNQRIWDTLEERGIAYTCHWGQQHGLTRSRIDDYFGSRVTQWLKARDTLLGHSTAKEVFASELLADVGLA